MSSPISAEWAVPGNNEREPQYFGAIMEHGRWHILSRFAGEVHWFDEKVTPQLAQRAEMEWRKQRHHS